MAKKCLACQVTVADIFAPCPACGARPTDPNLCKGPSIEAYQQEQLRGRGDFAASLKTRGDAAKGLEADLLYTVPMLYGSGAMHGTDPGIALAHLHREEIVRRNGGGLPSKSPATANARLPYEGILIAILVLYYVARILHRAGVL